MGIETNPSSVDDLNEAWPPDGDPALEGAAHLRGIKKAVKGRANVAGGYGVTTLSSALDSDAEDVAATSKAVKLAAAAAGDGSGLAQQAYDMAQQALDALALLDPELGAGSIPYSALWTISPGTNKAADLGDWPGMLDVPEYVLIPRHVPNWTPVVSFVPFNKGTFKFTCTLNTTSASNPPFSEMQLRLLRNGVEVFSELQSSSGSKAVSHDVGCEVGDEFEVQIKRFVNALEMNSGNWVYGSAFVTDMAVRTSGEKAILNITNLR
ncbi:phage tail protein [Idiomarina abyssalis]|uniref:phage tail protein n=1 Tax=Idiomarina abyssalis TaxID=86102 RepID=UPI003A93380E